MVRVLITGGSSFVAKLLVPFLTEQNHEVVVATRQPNTNPSITSVSVGNIDGKTDWSDALKGIDTVIHLAATPITPSGPTVEASWKTFMTLNRDGTARLVQTCADVGISKFIYLSSILACGEGSQDGSAFRDDGHPAPTDGYGTSKRAGEDAVREICSKSDMDYVILRPAPIYGPGLTNSILKLFDAAVKGWPLPVKSVENTLDFIYVDNLVSAISCVLNDERALGQTYFVCDQNSTSTPEFIRMIGLALGKSARLFSFPVPLLRLIGRLTGQQYAVGRLVDSIKVDGSKISKDLDWKPVTPMQTGITRTAEWYNKKL